MIRNWSIRIFGLWLLSLGAALALYIFVPWAYEAGIEYRNHVGFTILALVLMVSGVATIKLLYSPLPGIMINSTNVAIFYDAIGLLFGIAAAVMLVDIFFVECMGMHSIADDDQLRFMGAFFMVFGIPFLSLYTTRFTSQSIQVTSEGIDLISMSGKAHVSWNHIEDVLLSDEYIGVGRVGVVIPRQLQKRLIIIGRSGERLMINEPQLPSNKRRICEVICRYAPHGAMEKLIPKLKNW